jgi:hypothetical protein
MYQMRHAVEFIQRYTAVATAKQIVLDIWVGLGVVSLRKTESRRTEAV